MTSSAPSYGPRQNERQAKRYALLGTDETALHASVIKSLCMMLHLVVEYVKAHMLAPWGTQFALFTVPLI